MKIMVGTPAYGNHVTTNYLNSIIRAMDLMPDYIELIVNCYGGDSLITRGRNTMVAQFLSSDCDALLFVDADIGFDPHHIIRLVGAKKDVIAAIYPIKQINWDGLIEAVHANPDSAHYEDVAHRSLSLVTNGIQQPNQLGFSRAYEMGTGFMLIQRHVFLKMREKYPTLNYTTDMRSESNVVVDNFFDAFVANYVGKDADGKEIEMRRYLSEDYGFCALWRDMGGEVWADVGTTMLSHHGSYTYGQP
jgi:hypothetical protein